MLNPLTITIIIGLMILMMMIIMMMMIKNQMQFYSFD